MARSRCDPSSTTATHRPRRVRQRRAPTRPAGPGPGQRRHPDPRGAAARGGRRLPTRAPSPHEVVDRLFRDESGRAVATLIRVLGDFDLAEEAVQEAFVTALATWPVRGAFAAALEACPIRGVPDNPGAWITTTARNLPIDRLRRRRRLRDKTEELARDAAVEAELASIEPDETGGSDADMPITDD